MSEIVQASPEPTPVDDVRAIRRRLAAEFGNDVHRQAAHARKVVAELVDKLGLRREPPPTSTPEIKP